MPITFSTTTILWAMLILPWLSLFFIDKRSLKRFVPVAILVTLLITLKSELAYYYKWWVVDTRLFPQMIIDVPYVLGVFFAGTIWIFHFTFGRFWLYVLVNFTVDFLTAYPLNEWAESQGIYHLVNWSNWHVLLSSELHAMAIYLFQLWLDSAFKHEIRTRDAERTDRDGKGRTFRFGRKEKAR